MSLDDITAAYKAGKEAGYKSMPATDNPYPPDDLGMAWVMGRRHGLKETKCHA